MESPLDLAERVLDRLGDGATDGDEARVRATRVRHGLTRFANSSIHQHVGEDTTSVDVQLVRDGRVVQLSSTRTDEDGIAELVGRAREAVAAAPVDPRWPGLAPDEPAPTTGTVPVDDGATPDGRAAVVEEFVRAGGGLNAAGYCETEDTEAAHVATTGRVRHGRATRATVDGIHRTPTSAGSGHATGRVVADLDGAAVGTRAARLAVIGADPGDIDPGEYEVVLAPEPVATVLTFLSVYAFNGRAVNEGRSAVEPGRTPFDEAVTIVSDPTAAGTVSLPFDVEGTDRRRLPLVDAGTVVGVAHDRRTAAEVGATSTGNHLEGSSRFGPFATALRLEPGEGRRQDLVGDVERGILVTAFNYCRVLDPKSLVVTGLTRNGTFLVEDGEIVRPLGNLRFTQSFTEAFGPGRVLGIAADARFADGEFGPGFAIAPSVRLASWSITGNQQG